MQKRWKLILNLFTILALAVMVYLTRHQVVEALKRIPELNLVALIMIIPIQTISYYAVARYYKSYFKTLGVDTRLKHLAKVSLEMNFVNQVFPSGGVSGFSYLSHRMSSLGVSGAKATNAQAMRFTLTFLATAIYVFLGLIILAAFGRASSFVIMIATFIICGALTITAVTAYIVGSTARIKSLLGALPKFINFVATKFRIKKGNVFSEEKLGHYFEALHKDYMMVIKNWRNLKTPFLWLALMLAMEIATIYVVYVAFGDWINPGALVLGYAVANIAGLVSIIPGGVGVYEALMAGTMNAVGIPGGVALSVTVVYRLLNMLIFLPPGYYFYHKVMSSEGGRVEKQNA
jgi:putative heme transporter